MSIKSSKTLAALLAAVAMSATMAASVGSAEAKWGRNAALFGGLAAGALAVGALSNAYAAPAYSAPSCWREDRPVYNRFGDVVGYRSIRVCQ